LVATSHRGRGGRRRGRVPSAGRGRAFSVRSS